MINQTHIERFNKLIRFMDLNFKEDINSKTIEEISCYSYRNINRIFLALHQETIGQYIKRLRLEKAAEYIKYSKENITEIANEIGYSDVAAFTKAFKNHFKCSPTVFRNSNQLKQRITTNIVNGEAFSDTRSLINFEIVELAEASVLYLTYYGSYDNFKEIDKTWNQLLKYAFRKNLIDNETKYMGEIMDDNEITPNLKCRYNAAIILKEKLDFKLKGFFQTKKIETQKYAKFIHKGSHESSENTYARIYSEWFFNTPYELSDKPTIEIYLNDDWNTPKDELITEIYIPIL